MILFQIFGVSAAFDGTVTINPVRNRPASYMKATNFRLRGKLFDIELNGDLYTVYSGGKSFAAGYGTAITLPL